jgi:hypothetical protein
VAAQSSHAAPSRPAGLNPLLGPEEKRRGTSLLYRDLGPTAALGSSPARDAAVACVQARSTGFMELVDAKIREPTGAHDGTGLMMQ